MKSGAELIADERARQINVEGYTAEHDAKHNEEDLLSAAEMYLAAASSLTEGTTVDKMKGGVAHGYFEWPWEIESWKPSPDVIVNLTKCGALIAAHIDRLQRKLN